ncbi:hypothetical protein FH972_017166 [Carpinus fangiana]|uniref:Leucine-rich repeat-containing N-terminal plant-type domain-containing protein n=1 Tax=Carpinus fangiana TaxID=176857 RepID=A0A5N6RI53_9ROSI|nr:hypothetical protein FH972_017166 [Carpinus fangiana]
MFGQSEVLVAPIEEQPYIQHCHVQKTCSVGSVIGLDLTNEAITGGRDNLSSLFNLQNLRKLSLAHNNFNGSQIPSEFEKMTNLNYLNLSNAGFAGQIPVEISCLTRSVSLDLSSVYFSDTTTLKLENSSLNVLIQNLTELVELNLDGVNISAQGNQWCQALSSSLPNLRVLSLSNCYLSGPIDSTLLKLQSLSIICLDNNNLSTPIPEFFANFTNLTSLRLSSSGMRGTFPRKIFQVPTLEILDLSNNRLLHGPLPDFPQNGSLRTLFIVTGLGFGVGAAVVVGPLMFWEKGRRWYDESIDKILLVVLPMMGLSYTGCKNMRAESEEDAEDENTEDYDDDEDETEDEEFRGRVAELYHYAFRNFIKQMSDSSMPEHTQELISQYTETMLLLIRDSDEVLNNLDLESLPSLFYENCFSLNRGCSMNGLPLIICQKQPVALGKMSVVNSIGKIESKR